MEYAKQLGVPLIELGPLLPKNSYWALTWLDLICHLFCQDICIVWSKHFVWFSLLGSFLFCPRTNTRNCLLGQTQGLCHNWSSTSCSLIINLRYLTWYNPSCLIFSPKLAEIAFIPPPHPADFTQHGQRHGWCHCWCRCQCPVPEMCIMAIILFKLFLNFPSLVKMSASITSAAPADV